MDFFLKDLNENVAITWDNLINDINNSTVYNPYCKSTGYYNIFKHLVVSLIIGKEIILLDSDFSDSELIKLTGYSNYEEFNQVIEKKDIPHIIDKENLIEKLKNPNDTWKITLYTSGTTGIPKKVSHNFKSITRFVKVSPSNANSIWGFAYNPSHMAGIQVFFQALLNGNTIVRLFGLNQKNIFTEIKENKITHLSATPTFYNLMLPYDEIFKSVISITSGGEKFNKKTAEQIEKVFPNAKIKNVYASTEAGTILASQNDIFSIKPQYDHLIKILNGELLIHNSLMGISEVNIEDWYNTGDLIEIVTETPLSFRFLSRKSDMINVGGYKVNPLEVEETILTLSSIKNVRVYSKSNSVMGNIICCDVVCDDKQINESTIRAYLQTKIQEFKIPRIFRFVDELSTTRTGKIKR